MSSTTPNLGLTAVTNSETIGDFSDAMNASGGNLDIIDGKMGAVGNTSLQAQITALNSKLAIKSHTVQNVTTDANASFISGLMVANAIIVGVNASVGTGFISVSGVYNGAWVMQVRDFSTGALKTSSNIGNIEILYRDR